MGLFGSIKCILTSGLLFWLIYHIATTCPLCQPLPYAIANGETDDSICKYTHEGYTAIKPYTEPIVTPVREFYDNSPIKPYVDDSIVIIGENYAKYLEPYVPIVKEHLDNVYGIASANLLKLKDRLDNDGLKNEKIVIPAEDELDAFIGTPNPEQEKTLDPVTPEDDVLEPTPVPEEKEEEEEITNVVPETTDVEEAEAKEEEEPTPEPVAEPSEEVEPLPEETEAAESVEEPVGEPTEGKIEEFVEEAETAIEMVAAEEIIEAATAVGAAVL